MSNYSKIIILLLLCLTGWFAGCYKGNGLKPQTEVSGIQGTIQFTGEWPDSTRQVWVAVLKNYPEGVTDTAAIRMFVINNLVDYQAVPSNVDSCNYEFNLDPGNYDWVLVVWFPDIQAWILGAKQLGAYYANPDDTTRPTGITVESGVIQEGIDIHADMNRIKNDFPFF